MLIRVKGYVTFRALVGQRTVEVVDGHTFTLRGLLEQLGEDLGAEFREQVFDPASGEIRPHVSILVNGRQWNHLAGRLETDLKDGDEVAIFPPIAGGGPKE